VAFSEFFGLPVSESKRAPAWMKKIVRDMFGSTCAACGREAETIDHVVARTKGGMTEVVNLQPLCDQCNQEKANKDVDIVTITLTFPLRPPPSGEGDLFIW
jgi:5-methylcytosine-specific restriction endonuclease McrA